MPAEIVFTGQIIFLGLKQQFDKQGFDIYLYFQKISDQSYFCTAMQFYFGHNGITIVALNPLRNMDANSCDRVFLHGLFIFCMFGAVGQLASHLPDVTLWI